MPVPSELDPPFTQPTDLSSAETAIVLQTLPPQEQLAAMQGLSPAVAVEVFQNWSEEQQQQFVQHFRQSPLGVLLEQQGWNPLGSQSQIFEPTEPIDDGTDYFQTNLLARAANRVLWLVVLLLANTATTAVIHAQESVLQQVVTLAAFIPLLIGSGGNVSTQSATVMVRAISQAEVSWRVTLKRIIEQALVAVLLGLVLGAVVTGLALVLQDQWDVAIVVGVSLFSVAIVAAISGSTLPYLFKALGFDPALMSAPVSSVVVDILGVWLYLQFACWILHLF